MEAYSTSPSVQGLEAGGSEVQEHPLLWNTFEGTWAAFCLHVVSVSILTGQCRTLAAVGMELMSKVRTKKSGEGKRDQ